MLGGRRIYLPVVYRSSYIFMIVEERNKICWSTSSEHQEVEVSTNSEVSDIWFLYVLFHTIGTVNKILPWRHSRHVEEQRICTKHITAWWTEILLEAILYPYSYILHGALQTILPWARFHIWRLSCQLAFRTTYWS